MTDGGKTFVLAVSVNLDTQQYSVAIPPQGFSPEELVVAGDVMTQVARQLYTSAIRASKDAEAAPSGEAV